MAKKHLTTFELTLLALKRLEALRKKWATRSRVQTVEEAIRVAAAQEGIR